MAEGLLRHDGGPQYEVFSAGTQPSHVRPEAIQVMREVGIDISGHRSKSVEEFAGQHFDYVITVCDNAKESCPIFPATTKRIHWSLEDPAAVQGLGRTKAGRIPAHPRPTQNPPAPICRKRLLTPWLEDSALAVSLFTALDRLIQMAEAAPPPLLPIHST